VILVESVAILLYSLDREVAEERKKGGVFVIS
jgi:hypothetical protein